jgi:hypothetical protein
MTESKKHLPDTVLRLLNQDRRLIVPQGWICNPIVIISPIAGASYQGGNLVAR